MFLESNEERWCLIVRILQVEFIIMGGTFMSMPEDYRAKFIAQLHNALSGYTGLDVDEAVRLVPAYFAAHLTLSN